MDQAAKLREMAQQRLKTVVLEDRGVQESTAEKKTTVFCITSGKGGVGKTSFSVNFAIALSRCQKKVLILDADFGFSNVNILLGANSTYNMSHVLSGEKKLNEIMEECFPFVWHISGGAGLMDLVHIDELRLKNVLAQLETLDGMVDYVLIDTGAGLNNNILNLIGASDRTILVMTAEPTSILDSYVVIKSAVGLPEPPRISALINKAESQSGAISTYENFSGVVKKHLNYDVEMLGYMPLDDKMTESISSLVPYTIQYPSRTLSQRIQMMADNITERTITQNESRGLKGFFGRLAGLRSNAK